MVELIGGEGHNLDVLFNEGFTPFGHCMFAESVGGLLDVVPVFAGNSERARLRRLGRRVEAGGAGCAWGAQVRKYADG